MTPEEQEQQKREQERRNREARLKRGEEIVKKGHIRTLAEIERRERRLNRELERLVKQCAEKFGWKKSTTYTEIKRLSQKGVLKNENAVVTPLVTREEVQAKESDEFVERTFDGSLPGFLTAFLGGKKLSRQEAEDLKALIDNYQEEG